MHACPMCDGPKPHVGGPILPAGVPTVFLAGMPAAVVGTTCTCAGPPDTIVRGSATVFIGGKPAARMGDTTMHGGVITAGAPTVLIGDSGGGGAGTPQAAAMSAARQSAVPFISTSTAASDAATVWTEIELVDDDRLPVPGEAFVVTTPDGRSIEGALDANGYARLDGLEPGRYRVDFPRLDGRSWTAGG
jgi:uncharacterized Zn-binding protein involved in type VI secretion